MKILDKYVAKNFLIGYAIAFGVLIGMRITIDLFANLDAREVFVKRAKALRALRESGGTAVAVSNEETERARTALREREGLLVEFSSAMPLAAVEKLVAAGSVSADESVVMLITSSGLKDPEEMNDHGEVPDVEPTMASLAVTLEQEYRFVA